MSISIKNKLTGLTQDVSLESDLVTVIYLKKLISMKYNFPQQNLTTNLKIFTRDDNQRQYQEHQFVKKGERIQFLFQDTFSKSEQQNQQKLSFQQKTKLGITSPQQLEAIINDSKIYMIKSANQQNIQKAKDLSIWATTFSNQERLKYSFNTSKHVLLLFATNRSFQIKGLARMECQPQKNADKSVWAGVSNIRLGGNFKIKWLRKKPLSLVNVEKAMGNLFKQMILRSCDGQQIDPVTCKPLAFLFQTPTQPFYSLDQIKQEQKQRASQKKIEPNNAIHFIPALFMPPSMSMFPNPAMSQISIPFNYQNIVQKQSQTPKRQSQKKSSQAKNKSKKQLKKHKKLHKEKKLKKSKRKYLTSSDSSQQSSNSSSQQSSQSSYSQSYQSAKREKKKKKIEKHRKRQKKDKKSKKDKKK